jgi:hypothetical protein
MNRRAEAKKHPVGSWVISETWRTAQGERFPWMVVWRVEEGQKPGPIVYENLAMRSVDRQAVYWVRQLLIAANATSDEESVAAALKPYNDEQQRRLAELSGRLFPVRK